MTFNVGWFSNEVCMNALSFFTFEIEEVSCYTIEENCNKINLHTWTWMIDGTINLGDVDVAFVAVLSCTTVSLK